MEREQLESMTVNGLDLVLLMLNSIIQMVACVSPTDKAADERLITLANKLEEFAGEVKEPRMKLLMTELAHALIATERSA
jgi:hypothetical protein